MVQPSHPNMTNGKTIALPIWAFVGKMMSLLFNMLSGCVIAFLPRSKSLSISWLWSLLAVILESKKIKPVTVFIFSPSICHEVMGLDVTIPLTLLGSKRNTLNPSVAYWPDIWHLSYPRWNGAGCCKPTIIGEIGHLLANTKVCSNSVA